MLDCQCNLFNVVFFVSVQAHFCFDLSFVNMAHLLFAGVAVAASAPVVEGPRQEPTHVGSAGGVR